MFYNCQPLVHPPTRLIWYLMGQVGISVSCSLISDQPVRIEVKVASVIIPFRPMEFSTRFDTVTSGWSIVYTFVLYLLKLPYVIIGPCNQPPVSWFSLGTL